MDNISSDYTSVCTQTKDGLNTQAEMIRKADAAHLLVVTPLIKFRMHIIVSTFNKLLLFILWLEDENILRGKKTL